jgi:CDP-glycerol glycerophosphotransferase (TagB/SpsB family)
MIKHVKIVLNFFGSVILWPLKYLVPKKDIILMRCCEPDVYCDNTRFLFEYLSENTKYQVYWLTISQRVKDYLDNRCLRYLDPRKKIYILWMTLRTKIIIESGDSYFNPFKLSDNHITVKISTMHGSGLKIAHMRTDNLSRTILPITRLNRFDYCNFTSKYTCTWVAKRLYLLPTKKILKIGYPRCDFFFDIEFVNERYKKKEFSRVMAPNFDLKSSKVILYTPTWRPYEYTLPLLGMTGFEINKFNSWLKSNNFFFFYTIHTGNAPCSKQISLSNIIFIDHPKYPIFDINLFMLETDILLNDYSTISTEYSILRKPQIFYMHDYEYFEEEKGFVENYKSFLPGKEVNNFYELIETLNEFILHPQNYLEKYEKNIKILLDKYYDISLTNSCASFAEIVKKIIQSSSRIELVDTSHLKKNVAI